MAPPRTSSHLRAAGLGNQAGGRPRRYPRPVRDPDGCGPVAARKALDFVVRRSDWLAHQLRDGASFVSCWRTARKEEWLHECVGYDTFRRWARLFADYIQQPPRRGKLGAAFRKRVEQAAAREGAVIDAESVPVAAPTAPRAGQPASPALLTDGEDPRKARRAAALGGKSADQIQQEALARALRNAAS